MKADPSRQRKLLDLQAIDTRLDQIAHSRRTLPEIPRLAELEQQAAELRTKVVRAETELSDVQREVAKAEADVQQVRDRAARDQSRLDSGVGTAKDLQAIQHELTSLARRQSELEDLELEVMERAEQTESTAARLQGEEEALGSEIAEVTAARDARLAELAADEEQAKAPRAGAVGQVGDDLVALYEKIRATTGGVAAAPLERRRCGGCQLDLNPVDLSKIAKAAPDEVIRCEECRRILVRTPESGL
ncbi:zinc ribbon domain-containing protein [Actinomycetota bacterium]